MIYSDKNLIIKAKLAEGFEKIPSGYWLLYIRKNVEDRTPNCFDCICYLMEGEKSLFWTTCTTVPGTKALLRGFRKYNKFGAAVIASNIWMYDSFKGGLHAGRMKALRQIKKIWGYRDGNLNSKAEQIGKPVFAKWYTNIHASSWSWSNKIIQKFIGSWSFGCLVHNDRKGGYNEIIERTYNLEAVSVLILDEFSV